MTNDALEHLTEVGSRRIDDLKAQLRYREDLGESGLNSIDFSSNDYLGLRTYRQISEEAYTQASLFGNGAGASRVVARFDGQLPRVEREFAEWRSVDGALVLPSGMIANKVAFEMFGQLCPGSTEVFLDHRAHYSLHSAVKNSGLKYCYFRHGDYNNLEQKLKKCSARLSLVVIESLHSMDGTFENGEALTEICERYDSLIYVDEAHSVGICGDSGSGWLLRYPKLAQRAPLAMLGCGKALGVAGGVLAGNGIFIDLCYQLGRSFIYSTGLPPFLVAALGAARRVVSSQEGEERRAKLWSNVSAFSRALLQSGVVSKENTSPIFSIVMAGDSRRDETRVLQTMAQLQARGYDVRAMRPPTVPQGTSRLRVVVHSSHEVEQLESLADALSRVICL